jgi:hypothetical protein
MRFASGRYLVPAFGDAGSPAVRRVRIGRFRRRLRTSEICGISSRCSRRLTKRRERVAQADERSAAGRDRSVRLRLVYGSSTSSVRFRYLQPREHPCHAFSFIAAAGTGQCKMSGRQVAERVHDPIRLGALCALRLRAADTDAAFKHGERSASVRDRGGRLRVRSAPQTARRQPASRLLIRRPKRQLVRHPKQRVGLRRLAQVVERLSQRPLAPPDVSRSSR